MTAFNSRVPFASLHRGLHRIIHSTNFTRRSCRVRVENPGWYIYRWFRIIVIWIESEPNIGGLGRDGVLFRAGQSSAGPAKPNATNAEFDYKSLLSILLGTSKLQKSSRIRWPSILQVRSWGSQEIKTHRLFNV